MTDKDYGDKFMELLELYGDKIVYLEDKGSLLGISAIEVDVDEDGIVFVTRSESDEYCDSDFYSTFAALFGVFSPINFAIYKPFACAGKFVSWEEFCNIIDGKLNKKLGNL